MVVIAILLRALRIISQLLEKITTTDNYNFEH